MDDGTDGVCTFVEVGRVDESKMRGAHDPVKRRPYKAMSALWPASDSPRAQPYLVLSLSSTRII